MPTNYEGFLKVPGIGDYVASALLSLHMNSRAMLIDSNIVRLYGRFSGFEFDNETRRKKWLKNLADQTTPKRGVKSFNYAVLDYSRLVCAPKPNCMNCILIKQCCFYEKEY